MREIKDVKVLPNYELLLTFDNNHKKIKDMKPYLNKGVFQKLKDENLFKQVKIKYGSLSWDEDIDMCADSLYTSSKSI